MLPDKFKKNSSNSSANLSFLLVISESERSVCRAKEHHSSCEGHVRQGLIQKCEIYISTVQTKSSCTTTGIEMRKYC